MSGRRGTADPRPIVIAGGGIGGLACALALAQKGYATVVCEQASEFGQIGAGLQVAPNALAVLDALGVGAEVKSNSLLIERMLLRDGLSGDTIVDIPCDAEFVRRFGNPYAVSHRADVHGALLKACRDRGDLVQLRTHSRVVDYVVDPARLEVDVVLADGGRIAGASLIGADGIKSRIREHIVGDGEPDTAGAVIYRALVPAALMPPQECKPYPTMWAGPGCHIVYYPVRGRAQFNLGITVLKPTASMVEGKADRAEALEGLDAWHASPLSVVSRPPEFQRYIIRHRNPTTRWNDGIVTMIGDAAHPMVQYIAQGAAMALEDALCLADRVDACQGDFEAAFAAYQATRLLRTARVQISSMMLGKLYHPEGIERLVRNELFRGRTAAESHDRLAWLYTAPDYVQQWQGTR